MNLPVFFFWVFFFFPFEPSFVHFDSLSCVLLNRGILFSLQGHNVPSVAFLFAFKKIFPIPRSLSPSSATSLAILRRMLSSVTLLSLKNEDPQKAREDVPPLEEEIPPAGSAGPYDSVSALSDGSVGWGFLVYIIRQKYAHSADPPSSFKLPLFPLSTFHFFFLQNIQLRCDAVLRSP